MGQVKADYIATRKPAHQFQTLSMEEKNEIISRDPAYAHIICRCEMVSEGEIVEVLMKGYQKGEKIIRHPMVKVAN